MYRLKLNNLFLEGKEFILFFIFVSFMVAYPANIIFVE